MPKFHGETYCPLFDQHRLTRQLDRVRLCMSKGGWYTLDYIAGFAGGSEASVSARLRDLRKRENGGFIVNRRRVPNANGLWEYQMENPR